MQLALSPNVTFPVVLKCDLTTTTQKRPTFKVKYLTGAEWEQVASIDDRLSELDKKSSGPDAMDIIYEAVALGIAGWKNMVDPKTKKQIPFRAGVKQLKKVIGFADAKELIDRILKQQKPTASDLKNLG